LPANLCPNRRVVRAADRQSYQGRQRLSTAAPENLDRAWVAITSDPRCIDQRQHPLKSALGTAKGRRAELRTVALRGDRGGRPPYAIDDANRVLWITRAGAGHPKQTDH
jgi:hypothetical protein